MKFLNGIAAVALVLTPAMAPAQSAPQSQADCEENEVFVQEAGQPGDCRPVAGAAAQGEALPVLTTIPEGALIVGGLVILGGVIIGVIAATDNDNNNAVTTTTTTTN